MVRSAHEHTVVIEVRARPELVSDLTLPVQVFNIGYDAFVKSEKVNIE